MKKKIITLLASIALVFGIGCVSCETVQATIVQEELQQTKKPVTLVRFLLYEDTDTGKILGRQHQTVTVDSLNSNATFKPFAPISPQLPNYKVDKIVGNVPCSWEQADNTNHQAPTVYVYISKVKVVNNYGGNKNVRHMESNRGTDNNHVNTRHNRQSNKQKRVKHNKKHVVNEQDEVVQSKGNKQGNKLFWIVTILGLLFALFLFVAGIRMMFKNKKD